MDWGVPLTNQLGDGHLLVESTLRTRSILPVIMTVLWFAYPEELRDEYDGHQEINTRNI